MGQRQDQDVIIYGNDCSLGFEEGKTPKYLYARFTGIIQCPDLNAAQWKPPPNGRTFKLTQDPDHPCFWSYDIPPWHLTWEVSDLYVHTVLFLSDEETGGNYFSNIRYNLPEERHVYHNDYTICSGYVAGIEGEATVTWGLTTLELLRSLNIETAYDLFMELHTIPDSNLVFKYCKLKDGTNIKIKLEP